MATGACAQSDRPPSRPGLATPETLWAKISAAKPGATVVLAAGDYGVLSLGHMAFAAPGVIVQPAPGAKVVFSAIQIGQSEGITIKDVEIDVRDPKKDGVSVGHSSRIVLSGLKIHAPTNTGPSAMMLRFASDVTVEDCDIENVSFGINFLDSDHLKILRNNFKDLKVDAIRGSASYVEVAGNHASSFHPQAGDHPDFIQFWGAGKAGPNKSNVIKDNIYERGSGDVVQGIFIEDNDDVTISGNGLLGTMYNAISMARVHHALVEDNFIQSYDDMGSRIITRGESSDVTIRNNVATEIVDYREGGKPNPGYKEERNRKISSVKVGDTKDLVAWQATRAAR